MASNAQYYEIILTLSPLVWRAVMKKKIRKKRLEISEDKCKVDSNEKKEK